MEQFGGILSRGFCLGGFCPRGDFVQGDFVRGFCLGGFVRGDFVLEPYWDKPPSLVLFLFQFALLVFTNVETFIFKMCRTQNYLTSRTWTLEARTIFPYELNPL